MSLCVLLNGFAWNTLRPMLAMRTGKMNARHKKETCKELHGGQSAMSSLFRRVANTKKR
jgi:hypothetical protein